MEMTNALQHLGMARHHLGMCLRGGSKKQYMSVGGTQQEISSSIANLRTVPRDEWRSVGKCLIFPVDPWKEAWDIMMLALILYSSVSVPVRVCFDAEATGMIFCFEVVMSIVFVM
jgi:hypothetical protein